MSQGRQSSSANFTLFYNTSTNSTMDPGLTNFCIDYSGIEELSVAERAVQMTAYSMAFVLAFFGNILAISIILRNSHLKTTTNYFILNMAATDVLLAVICMPSSIYSIGTNTRGQIHAGGAIILAVFLCKMYIFLQGLSIAVSVLTLTAIATERFLAIVYPFKNLITVPIAKALIAIAWIAGAAFISPLIYAIRVYDNDGNLQCYEDWGPAFDVDTAPVNYTIVLFVLIYAAPLLIITALYSILLKELWRGSQFHSDKRRAYEENKSVLKMLVTVIVAFAVCYLPLHVITFVSLFTTDPVIKTCGPKAVFLFLGYFIGHLNSAINPVIYFTFNETFRREIAKMTGLIKRCFIRRGDEGKTRRPTPLATVSFDLKKVSIPSPGVGKKDNSATNCAIEITDEC